LLVDSLLTAERFPPRLPSRFRDVTQKCSSLSQKLKHGWAAGRLANFMPMYLSVIRLWVLRLLIFPPSMWQSSLLSLRYLFHPNVTDLADHVRRLSRRTGTSIAHGLLIGSLSWSLASASDVKAHCAPVLPQCADVVTETQQGCLSSPTVAVELQARCRPAPSLGRASASRSHSNAVHCARQTLYILSAWQRAIWGALVGFNGSSLCAGECR